MYFNTKTIATGIVVAAAAASSAPYLGVAMTWSSSRSSSSLGPAQRPRSERAQPRSA
jgi:hypothetical protein